MFLALTDSAHHVSSPTNSVNHVPSTYKFSSIMFVAPTNLAHHVPSPYKFS